MTTRVGSLPDRFFFCAPDQAKVSKPGYGTTILLLLALMLGLRFLAMALVPLIPEEAYYWMYAKNPDFSYYDHPPMVAWVIGAGTAIFGETQFGVRIVNGMLMIGASLLMYQFGRSWFGHTAGLMAAVFLQILPVYFGTGFIATMDAALLFFWLLCMVGVTFALKENRAWGWYLAGAGLGLAMLSKYTGVFLAPGVLLAVIAHRPWRRQLLSVHPYLGLLLALVLFSPVLFWNAQHDWASFRFQFLNRWDADPLSIENILQFIGFQILVATPLLLWAWGVLIPRRLRRRRGVLAPRYLIALAFSLPLLSIMAYKSLRYGIHLNWTLPAYLSLFPVAGYWFALRMPKRSASGQRTLFGGTQAAMVVACMAINIFMIGYLLILQPRLQWISAFGPWNQLAAIVEEYEDKLEQEGSDEPLIVAEGKYRLASVLAFYRQPLELEVDSASFTTSMWPFGGNGLGYPYWSDLDDWKGRNVLYVDDSNSDLDAILRPHFREIELVSDERLLSLGGTRYRLAIGYHLQ
jgi:dolichol-phosphate mannosyltransferase